MTDPRPGPVVLIIAVLLPTLLSLAWLAPLTTSSWHFEHRLGEGAVEPLTSGADVVVVGNSLSQFGVDRELLADGIGADSGVDLVWFPGAAAPSWYAALKNGVFAHGDRPKLIVVVNTMRMMLTVDLPEDRQLADLRGLLTADEPVIAAKVFKSTEFDSPWARALARRSEPRDLYINGFKQLPYLIDSKPLERANEALDLVFGGQNIASAADRQRMIPIVEIRDQSRSIPATFQVSPRDSLIPDLVELSSTHGAKIVFARVPIPRSGRKYWPLTSVAEDQATVALLNELGAGYIDLHDLPLSESDFVDDHHLGRSGQLEFTRLLASALVEIGAIGDGPIQPAEIPRTFRSVKRIGSPPAIAPGPAKVSGCSVFIPIGEPYLGLSDGRLEFLGLGPASPIVAFQGGRQMYPTDVPGEPNACAGTSYHLLRGMQIDASGSSSPEDWSVALSNSVPLPGTPDTWWVYPGTSLELQFDASDIRESRVGLVALQTTRSDARPSLTVSGGQVPLKKYGLRWVGISDTLSLAEDWSLSLSSPEDGPFLVMSMLAVRNGPDASFVVGGPEDMNNTLRFLGTRTSTVRHARRSHEIAQEPIKVVAGELPTIQVENAEAVTAQALMAWAEKKHSGVEVPTPRVMAKCSPLQLYEDSAPLEAVETIRYMRGVEGRGKYTSYGSEVVLRPSDGRVADHTYKVVLSGRRWCRKHLYWLYPGDHAAMSLIEPGRLHAGAGKLLLGAFVFGDPEATVKLRFHAGEKVVLDTELRAGDLEGEPVTLHFLERIPPATKNLRLEWMLPQPGPFLLVNFGLLAP